MRMAYVGPDGSMQGSLKKIHAKRETWHIQPDQFNNTHCKNYSTQQKCLWGHKTVTDPDEVHLFSIAIAILDFQSSEESYLLVVCVGLFELL